MVNKHHQNHKERLRKEARKRYENLFEKENEKGVKNVRDKKKQTLCAYMRRCHLAHKRQLIGLYKDPRAIRLASRKNP